MRKSIWVSQDVFDALAVRPVGVSVSVHLRKVLGLPARSPMRRVGRRGPSGLYAPLDGLSVGESFTFPWDDHKPRSLFATTIREGLKRSQNRTGHFHTVIPNASGYTVTRSR